MYIFDFPKAKFITVRYMNTFNIIFNHKILFKKCTKYGFFSLPVKKKFISFFHVYVFENHHKT